VTEKKHSTGEYMEKKLRLLYIQTALNVVQVICLILLIVWMFMHPDVLKAIFD
jgi:hypothetical protein